MKSFATRGFWVHHAALTPDMQKRAKKAFELFKQDPFHPSLQFKKVGDYWSARVGSGYRALANRDGADVVWVWIGPDDEYERLINAN